MTVTVAESTLARASLDELVERPSAPYPGLRPFRSNEWSIFCGREVASREVMYKLGEHNVVFVHGGSGSGKSSLIAAGVLPALDRDCRFGGQHMASATIRPSEGPLTALAGALAEHLGPPPDGDAKVKEAEASPAANPQTSSPGASRSDAEAWVTALLFADDIVERIETAIAAKNLQLFCLVIDQFEEIFRWARERRASDVEALTRFIVAIASPGRGERLAVIITMRSDFLSQCALFPDLSGVINNCQYYVPNLDRRGMERAIREPAQMFGGTITDELVTRLITEASSTIDALPVMQHALMRMAQPYCGPGARNWNLGLEDYRRVTAARGGGSKVPGRLGYNALSVHADEIRTALIADKGAGAGEAVETVMRALFDTDSGGRIVRRPTTLAQLEAMAGANAPFVEAVIDIYCSDGNNLLLRSRDRQSGEITIDISHEALLRNWWRMAWAEDGIEPGWVQQEADEALNWRMLARIAATEDAKLDRAMMAKVQPSYAKLVEAPERARRYFMRDEKRPNILDEPEWQAVAGLIARSRRSLRRRRWAAGVAGALLLVSVLVAVAQERRRIEAEFARQQAELARQQSDIMARANYEALLKQGITTLISETAEKEGGGETALTQKAGALAQIAESSVAAAQTLDRYLWIGDEDLTNLADARSGRPVLPTAVRPNARYRVTRYVALRATLPTPPNQSGPLVGSVKPGTQIVALGEPRLWPGSGQYWLKVETDQAVTVYIQYGSGDPTAVRQSLIRAGYNVPRAERVKSAGERNEVRFCHQQDGDAAARVARLLGGKVPLQTHWIGNNVACARNPKPGTIELWISEPG